MMAWSIETALSSGCFDRVIVSTDDNEIAQVARDWGAEVPFMRPVDLSGDYTGTIPVVKNGIEHLQSEGKTVEYVCCLYATAPFVQADDLRRGLVALIGNDVDYTFSVTSFAFPIQRAVRLTEQGRVAMFQPEHFGTRSQDLEEAYHDAGQFYWGTVDAWLSGRPMFSEAAIPVMLPRHRVQDIDTPEDWQRAEWLFRAMQADG